MGKIRVVALRFCLASGAEAADFGAGDGDGHAAVLFDLLLELLVEFGFEFADFAAAKAGDVDVVARAVGFVIVAMAAKMEQVEFVNQALALEQIERAIDGDAGDSRVHFPGAREDFRGVEMARGGVHHLQDDAALARQANAALREFALEVARRGFDVDAFAGGDAMASCRVHDSVIFAA